MADLTYITGRLVDPSGEVLAGVVVRFIPVSALSVNLEEYLAKFTVAITTTASGLIVNLGSTTTAGLRPGTYKVQISGVDVYEIAVPDDGGTHALTSLIV
jgi:hypothetical protein